MKTNDSGRTWTSWSRRDTCVRYARAAYACAPRLGNRRGGDARTADPSTRSSHPRISRHDLEKHPQRAHREQTEQGDNGQDPGPGVGIRLRYARSMDARQQRRVDDECKHAPRRSNSRSRSGTSPRYVRTRSRSEFERADRPRLGQVRRHECARCLRQVRRSGALGRTKAIAEPRVSDVSPTFGSLRLRSASVCCPWCC